MSRDQKCLVGLLALAICLVFGRPGFAQKSDGPNPGIIPPNASYQGLTYGEWAAEWAKWWEDHREGFVARRALTAIPAAVRGDLRVRVEGTGAAPAGPCLYSAVAADAPLAGGAGGRFVALAPDEADRVAAAVEASGLLALPEGRDPEEAAPHLELGTARLGRDSWLGGQVRETRLRVDIPA